MIKIIKYVGREPSSGSVAQPSQPTSPGRGAGRRLGVEQNGGGASAAETPEPRVKVRDEFTAEVREKDNPVREVHGDLINMNIDADPCGIIEEHGSEDQGLSRLSGIRRCIRADN